jgi:hypothetical protein
MKVFPLMSIGQLVVVVIDANFVEDIEKNFMKKEW